jgi:twinkle protein
MSKNKVFTKNDLMNQLSSFLAKEKPKGYNINVECIDKLMRFETGRLCVITGIPQSGKSEVIDFFNIRLNQLHGWKSVYFSPENHPTGVYHLHKLLCKHRQEKVNLSDMITENFANDIDYLSNNFFFLNYEIVNDIDAILEEAQILIDKENIKILTIDPYNRLEHQYTGFNETQYISTFLDKLTRFAQKNDILVNLAAHPTKQKEGEEITGYSICGSHNFFDKADYMYSVKRNFDDDIVELKILKVKFKNLGCIGKLQLKYDDKSGNYYEADKEKYDPISFYLDSLEIVNDSEVNNNNNNNINN